MLAHVEGHPNLLKNVIKTRSKYLGDGDVMRKNSPVIFWTKQKETGTMAVRN